MEKELWEKSQMLVDAGLGRYIKHLYVQEIADRLTKEQLEKLGDISSVIDRLVESKTPNMESVIEHLIYLSREGVIIGPKTQP